MNEWINAYIKQPKYIPNTYKSKDVIICAKFGDRYVVHVGWYESLKWHNTYGAELNVIKWMEFPTP
jgi:hypothetical protein